MDQVIQKTVDYKDRKAVVYVERTAVDDILTKWYHNHNIQALPVKCNAWNWLMKQRNSVLATRIHTLLKLDKDCQVKFSYKAGCSCGCSPGFTIKRLGCNEPRVLIDGQSYSNVWVEIDTNDLIDTFHKHVETATNKLIKEQNKGK